MKQKVFKAYHERLQQLKAFTEPSRPEWLQWPRFPLQRRANLIAKASQFVDVLTQVGMPPWTNLRKVAYEVLEGTKFNQEAVEAIDPDQSRWSKLLSPSHLQAQSVRPVLARPSSGVCQRPLQIQ